MSDSVEINYAGPLPLNADVRAPRPWWKTKVFAMFAIVVILPTLLASIYFLLIASPRYVSEARFVVRKSDQQAPAALGLALAGAGLSANVTDAFIVHEFIRSRAAIDQLKKRHDLSRVFSPSRADPLSRAIKPWQAPTEENLFKGTEKFIVVGYDATTGISTLRTSAFSPGEAKAVADSLLLGGESVVNQLNIRASRAAVLDAERSVLDAQNTLMESQAQLSAFRSREQLVDPGRAAVEGGELIGKLLGEVATLQAQRREMQAEAPNSPLLPSLDRRIAAYEQQISVERAKLAGSSSSLAPKIGAYETLVFEREVADRSLAAARQALESARIDARRQQLFLDLVVAPNLPDQPLQPRRLLSILAVFASTLLIFGCAYLVWAGLREHNHE